MAEQLLIRLIIVASGIFCIVAAIKDWNWFMNHRRAWIFVKLLGRKGARVFYIALGSDISKFFTKRTCDSTESFTFVKEKNDKKKPLAVNQGR